MHQGELLDYCHMTQKNQQEHSTVNFIFYTQFQSIMLHFMAKKRASLILILFSYQRFLPCLIFVPANSVVSVVSR